MGVTDNRYAGYRVSQDDCIDRVKPSIDAKLFFEEYVAKRKPCILTGLLTDEEWKAGERWIRLEYLKEAAGDVLLEVEERASASDAYGQGKKVQLSFAELLRKLEEGNDRYYLTTQELKLNRKTGVVELHASPVSELIGDLPLRPKIARTLVPQQINLWLGNSVEGSTTGLHHDFHDNIYILLRGRKRFTLYSPADADNMYLRGQVALVHPNGRFVYANALETRADGVEIGSRVHVADRMTALEADIHRLESLLRKAEAKNVEGEVERIHGLLSAAEDELDSLLGQTVELDEIDSDMDDGRSVDLKDYIDDFDEHDGEESGGEESGGDSSEGNDTADLDSPPIGSSGNAEQVDSEPLSFSLAGSITKDERHMREDYPKLLAANKLVADINMGEMLYLPAGWFHEVQSFGTSAGVSGEALHMALNYWFHPPDSDSYDSPYSDPVWERAWSHTYDDDLRPKTHRTK